MSKAAFLRVAAVSIGMAFMIWVYAAVYVWNHGGETRPTGWTSAWNAGRWEVSHVDDDGPAAGRLRSGDQVIAIDSDLRAGRIGPRWLLQDRPDKRSYSITVERARQVMEVNLPLTIVHNPVERGWLFVHLLSGLIFILTGGLVAFGKPESRIAHYCFYVALLTLGFWILVGLDINSGILTGFSLLLAMGLMATRPFHFMAGYYFYSLFPSGEASRGRWHHAEMALNVVAFAAWIPTAAYALLRALGPEAGAAAATRLYPLSLVYDRAGEPLQAIVAGLCCLGIAAVCRRNYRAIESPDQRRRIKWVIAGTLSSVAPLVLLSPLLAMARAGFFSDYQDAVTTALRLANTCLVLMPIVIAYAVLKHRVLDIRVAIRIGLQYLLARNVLRAALALPVALMIYSIASHPERTIGELFSGRTAVLNLILAVLAGLMFGYRTAIAHRIDRRFFRDSYQQDQILTHLAASIAASDDPGAITQLVAQEIDRALHPSIFRVLPRGDSDTYAEWDSLSSTTTDPLEVQRDFTIPGVHLLVPVRGADHRISGLLALGEKRSEQPYTRNDMRLLEAVGAQIGLTWENLELRSRLQQEQRVRRQVMQRVDGGETNFVLECPECGACYDAVETTCLHDGQTLTASVPVERMLVGRYRLERLIGRGGMGAVYDATDLSLSRRVAIKVMIGDLFGDPSAVHRFSREARASAQLNHPNVVHIHDFGELSGGGAYLVLEFVDGRTLGRELQLRGPLPAKEAAEVLAQILDGVAAAHTQRIIHRDLKPENIMLVQGTEGGAPRVRILDFGLAMVRDFGFSDPKSRTQAGMAVGTISYMSREQFCGETVDLRTDIYALGLIALETVTGLRNARGPSFETLDQLLAERFPAATATEKELRLAKVLRQALARQRDDRFASVEAFRNALLDAVLELPAYSKRPAAAAAGDSDITMR